MKGCTIKYLSLPSPLWPAAPLRCNNTNAARSSAARHDDAQQAHPESGKSSIQCHAMLVISFLVCGAKPVWGRSVAATQHAAEATERQKRPTCSSTLATMYSLVRCWLLVISIKSRSSIRPEMSKPVSSYTCRTMRAMSGLHGKPRHQLTPHLSCCARRVFLLLVHLVPHDAIASAHRKPARGSTTDRRTFPFGKPQLAPDFQPFTMRHLSIAGFTMMAPNTGTLCCGRWVSRHCDTASARRDAPCTP